MNERHDERDDDRGDQDARRREHRDDAERPAQLRDVDLVGGLEHEARDQDREDQLRRDLDPRARDDERDREAGEDEGDRVGERDPAGDEGDDRRQEDEHDEQLDREQRRDVLHRRSVAPAPRCRYPDRRQHGGSGWTWDLMAGARSSAAADRGSAAGIATVLAAEGARVALIGRTADRVRGRGGGLGGIAGRRRPRDTRRACGRGRPGGRRRSAGWTCWWSTPEDRRAAPSTSLDEAAWDVAIDGHAPVRPAPHPRRAAAPPGGIGSVDPDRALVLGPGADPGPHDLERPPAGPRRADQVAPGRARAGPDQRPRAGPDRDGPDRMARRPAGGGGRDHASRRSRRGRRRRSRSGGTASRRRSAGSGRSCCRPRRRS